jgi:hypothetical protein
MPIETATAAVLAKLLESAEAFDPATGTPEQAELAAAQILAHRALGVPADTGSGIAATMGLAVPGSNGFLRRQIFRHPGPFTWTAPVTGPVFIQGLGAGSGASSEYPGASAAYAQKLLQSVAAGQSISLVIGEGGAGANAQQKADDGGTTTISGAPIGGTPLVLTGAIGAHEDQADFGAPGSATGPWDLFYDGAAALGTNRGGCSSGSPWGPGIAVPTSGTYGGAGWGGLPYSHYGAGTHFAAAINKAGGGLLTRGAASLNEDGEMSPFWDLRDADCGGGGSGGGRGGIGSGGGGASNAGPAPSIIGGGSGHANVAVPQGTKSGHGVGGGTGNNTNWGGDGGDAFVMLFWLGVN